MALLIGSSAASGQIAYSGKATHENVLLGMHFLHANTDCNAKGRDPVDIAPSFGDYTRFMPEDLRHMSYADFWHWWYEFERYKGDEKGLTEFDRIVNECLARGMKVKVDLAWSTWYTNDRDWEDYSNMAIGPVDVDDWVHLCDLLGRRYRGRVALWLLQGEANDLKNYWQGAPIEHVHEVYRLGSQAFKRADPGVMISIAGASPSVPREALDEWVKSNAAACKGLFDDVSMNYFGDVADPYGGLLNYYQSIRSILDELGEKDVEIGSGESSFQWAETSYDLPKNPPKSMDGFDPAKTPLCELKQAWRCNESLGTFFDSGGTKFVQWGTEYAPGGGWAWRWGFRKYQDWWGAWPETHKIPGTNIVYRYDNPDGRKVDLRPGWTSRQTDPYHPMWEVYRFWSQLTPPGAEAVRMGITATSAGPRVLKAATYLRTQDRCVALLHTDTKTTVKLRIDLGITGWVNGAPLSISLRNESIDYATGDRKTNLEDTLSAKVNGGTLEVELPALQGFTTLEVTRRNPDRSQIPRHQSNFDAEYLGQEIIGPALVGQPIECAITLRNTGRSDWPAEGVSLALLDDAGLRAVATRRLTRRVGPGEATSVIVQLPASDEPGYVSHFVRLRWGKTWFGPAFPVSAQVTDPDCPRKLVAFRELGHIRLRWFAPEHRDRVDHYEVYRSPGFGQPFSLLAREKGTALVDSRLEPDKAYYYHVVAVRQDGTKSRPSNEDNAKASSRPRMWDAEIIEHDVPGDVRLGDPHTVRIAIRNTGSKPWNLGPSKNGSRVALSTTAQWGVDDEDLLPRVYLATEGTLQPGESLKVDVPYVGPREGRFENHWVMTLEVPGKPKAYFGTPLLVETVVTPR